MNDRRKFLWAAARLAVFAPLTARAQNCQECDETIPIVFWRACDPVGAGLVASLARPGGNVTGYTILSPEIDAKRLAVSRELLPTVHRVGVLENSTNPYCRATRKGREQACQSLGIQPIFVEAGVAGELPNAVAEGVRQGGQGLLVPPDALFYEHRGDIMRAPGCRWRRAGYLARWAS